jgi:hypothetical protein
VVKEDPSLIRDGYSRAIINRNTNDYLRRLIAKQTFENKEAEIQKLKSDVEELKAMVQNLLQSQSK